MKAKSAKQKGKNLEDYVADQLVEKGLDLRARRNADSGAGNREKADIHTSTQINDRNLGFECKNYKVAHVQDWWKQADKLRVLGQEPIVAYKLGRESYQETKVILLLDTFLDLLVEANGLKPVKEVVIDSSRLKWKHERAKTAIKDLLKEL